MGVFIVLVCLTAQTTVKSVSKMKRAGWKNGSAAMSA
jgi:hypothetical protein